MSPGKVNRGPNVMSIYFALSLEEFEEKAGKAANGRRSIKLLL